VSLVLDASLALAWLFDDESTPSTEGILAHVAAAGAIVPMLWKLEVANALQSAMRRRRIVPEYRDASLARLARLPLAVDSDTVTHAWTTTLDLSDRLGLTIYDATYLELANRRGLPLATLDRELRTAAAVIDVSLFGLDP
jgi:predicted nucleic acid-binding protein